MEKKVGSHFCGAHCPYTNWIAFSRYGGLHKRGHPECSHLFIDGFSLIKHRNFGVIGKNAIPIGSMYAIPQMLAYIPYMDPMGLMETPVSANCNPPYCGVV